MKLKDKKKKYLKAKPLSIKEAIIQRNLSLFLDGVDVFSGSYLGATFAVALVNVGESVMFSINYFDDITTAHIIRYKRTLFNITCADVYEGYKNNLTLYCKQKK